MTGKEKQLDSLALIGIFLTTYIILKDVVINKLPQVVLAEIVAGSFFFSVIVLLIVYYIMDKR